MTYIAPDLSIDVVLLAQVEPPQLPLDVVLCAPRNNDDVSIGIDANIVVGAGVNLTIGDAPTTIISIDANISVSALLSLDVTEYVVGISIDAVLPINPQFEIIATYDSNVFRGAQLDVSSDLQYSKLQGIDKSGSFERGAITAQTVSEKIEPSKLLGIDNQVQFEANTKLTNSTQSLSEQSKLVGVSSKHQGEYHKFLAVKNTLKSESAKLVGQSDWLSFEAMLARQTQRKIQGEYSYLDAIMRHNSSEYGVLLNR